MIALENLTQHQLEKLADAAVGDIHVKAPAGAGKIFIAMYEMLDQLGPLTACPLCSQSGAVLLCAVGCMHVSEPKGCHFPDVPAQAVLSRLHAVRSARGWPDGVQIKNERISMVAAWRTYSMAVVDEAHHLYRDAEARDEPPSMPLTMLV